MPRLRIVLDEPVGQRQRAYPQAPVQQPRLRQRVQHLRAEAADRTFFHGDDDFVPARKPEQELGVERLQKSHVG